MSDAVGGYFGNLGQRGHVPALERLTGTVRLEWTMETRRTDVPPGSPAFDMGDRSSRRR